ncbi:hypothetical protein S100313_01249 [Pediococcus acidilactici]|nr:DUF1056 family protein [Pediococcus acidilactici]ARW26684.1 hypothetical protein S100313_01249 [Pediococcus acidilactici]
MIFKQFFATIWRYFDVLCFILSMIAGYMQPFYLGKPKAF